MSYVLAFVVGGAFCAAAQLLMDFTRWTPAVVLVLGVVAGAIVAGFGLYQPFAQFAGAGATIPLPGFGYSLVSGLLKELPKEGWVALFSGAFKSTGAGIKAALVFGLIASFVTKPRA